MKTLIKIAALAVLAAFAVISCTPEAKLTDFDWGTYNAKDNTGSNTAPDGQPTTASFVFGPDVSGVPTVQGTDTTTLKKDEFTFTAPTNSDFLKHSDDATVLAELQKFLSFHHFSVPVSTDGLADTLDDESLPYTLTKRLGNVVTLKFVTSPENGKSRIIAKIDGTKYTFAGGNKADKSKRGTAGEAVYDDFYSAPINFTGSGTPATFIAPGNRDWYLTLASSINPGTNPTSDTLNLPETTIATLSFVNLDGRGGTGMYTAIAAQLGTYLKIQRYENGSWSDVPSSAYTIPQPSPAVTMDFKVTGLTLTDSIPYRVIWDGPAPFIYGKDVDAKFFGVYQWIKILGANTSTTIATTSTQHDYYMSKVYGTPFMFYRTLDAGKFTSTVPTVAVYSKDSNNQNVVIDVTFTASSLTPGSYIKNYNDSKQVFKDNFKIAYYSDPDNWLYSPNNGIIYDTSDPPEPDPSQRIAPTVADFLKRPDVVYIPIKDLNFFNVGSTVTSGFDTVRITLDPAYRIPSAPIPAKYFYISSEIGYADNRVTFGDVANWQYGFFKAYEIAGSSF